MLETLLCALFLTLSGAIASARIAVRAFSTAIFGTHANRLCATVPFTNSYSWPGSNLRLSRNRNRFNLLGFWFHDLAVKLRPLARATRVIARSSGFGQAHTAHVHRANPRIFIVPVRPSSSCAHQNPLLSSVSYVISCHIWHFTRH